MKKKIKKFLEHLYININRPEMEVLPGHLAFYFIMMLIPLITLIGSLLTYIDIGTTSISEAIYNNLPTNIADVVMTISKQDANEISFWILLIPTLILASNGTYSMIVTSNSIYKVKNSRNVVLGYIIDRIKAFIMLIVLILIFIFLLLVPTFGNILFKIIGMIIANESIVGNLYYVLFNFFKYPISFLIIFFAVKSLYIIAPNTKVKRKQVNYGALFTSIMWIICTWGYSYYIEYFSSYETFYGGISSILFLMLWVYLLSYIFVLGMALNVSNYEIEAVDDKKEELIEDEIKEIE